MNMEVRVVIMDSKLELFLSKINLPKEDYNYFNEGKILKIKSTKDKLNWDFIIETKGLLPIKILEYLDENIKKGFPNLNTVTYEIVPKTVNKSLINSYFNYIINKLSLGKAVSMIFSILLLQHPMMTLHLMHFLLIDKKVLLLHIVLQSRHIFQNP